MEEENRTKVLYELAVAQANHEQQIGAELAGKAGLLTAVASLIAVALIEFWHKFGSSEFLLAVSALCAGGLLLLLAVAIGRKYDRPAMAAEWFR